LILRGLCAEIRFRPAQNTLIIPNVQRIATTYGIGPRYLHSTGQYHKGGTNTGLFILLTAGDATTTAVPEADYTFSVLKQAQALGDFEALKATGRDVVHFHFDAPGPDILEELEKIAESVRV
jgi:hypothetical protein